MNSLLITSFTIGFLGSLHCIGMCGGLVSALCMTRPKVWWPGLITYQLGRIVSYSLLGILFATLGLSLHGSNWIGDSQQVLMIFAGIVMLLFALNLGGWLPDPLSRLSGKVMQLTGLARWTQRASTGHSPGPWLMVGLLNGLLPCGLVYAGLALSLAAASPLQGGMVMLAFGLGTIPAMVLTPFIIRGFTPDLRGKLLKIAAIALIVLALFTLFRQSLHGDHGDHASGHEHAAPAMEHPHSPASMTEHPGGHEMEHPAPIPDQHSGHKIPMPPEPEPAMDDHSQHQH